jgi:Spy/CpxP family protein refolding chaperone
MKTFCRKAALPVGLLALGLLAPAFAASPYVSQADAPIKALTVEEQSALLDGQGMGFAKAAELNGYPGPKHVLELADQLGLSEAQRRATQALFERMRTDARAEGAALVEAERALDELYASKTATRESVSAQLARIETARARLRGLHLDAHLEQAALLDRHQIAMYARLRGYGSHNHAH